MNDTALQNPASSEEALLSSMEPMLRSLITQLRSDTVPDDGEITDLQAVLRDLLELRRQADAAPAAPEPVQFEDVSGEEIPDAAFLEELSRCPHAGDLLYQAAAQKLLDGQAPGLPEEDVRLLVQSGYLAPVQIRTDWGSGELLTITSKGCCCFSRASLAQQLRETQKFPVLPEGLCSPPGRWSTLQFSRAFLLHRYYARKGTGRYLIFSAPQNPETLAGCAVPPSAGEDYCLALTPDPAALPQDEAYLRELIRSPEIEHITLVLPSGTEPEALPSGIRTLASEKKVCFRSLEEEQNGSE